MIKCVLNEVEVSGPEMIVIPELAKLMRVIRKEMTEKHGQEYADNRMRECIKLVFLTEEEIKAENTRRLEELKNKRSICENDSRTFGRDTEKLGGSRCLIRRQAKNRYVSGSYALQIIH